MTFSAHFARTSVRAQQAAACKTQAQAAACKAQVRAAARKTQARAAACKTQARAAAQETSAHAGPGTRPARLFLLGTAALLAACAPAPDQEAADGAASDTTAEVAAPTSDAAAPTRSAGEARDAATIPGLDGLATSGVALTYRFAFRLPDAAVAEAQDRHLRACERLGRARCQVQDIVYEREGGGPIDARASFLIDPAAARGFASDAVDAVEALDGETTDSSVRGEELARGIDESQAQSARLGGDVERLRQRLARPGLSAAERQELQKQIDQLSGEMDTQELARRTSERRLATTPVQFTYTGSTGLAGVDPDRPFASAWSASTQSLGTAAAFLMTLLGASLPWLLMLGGVIFIIRFIRRRLNPDAALAQKSSATVGTDA